MPNFCNSAAVCRFLLGLFVFSVALPVVELRSAEPEIKATAGVLSKIPTFAAYGWNFFRDRDDAYLVGNTNLHKWMPVANCFGDGTRCGAALQSLFAGPFARWRRGFVIGEDRFLAVAIFHDGVSNVAESLIFKWMQSGACFGNGKICGQALQKVATNGARDVDIADIAGKHYLIFANYFDGLSGHGRVDLMQWLPELQCFGNGAVCNSVRQTFPVAGAFALDTMTIGSASYLIVGENFHGGSYQLDSAVYKWISAKSCFGDGVTCGAVLQKLIAHASSEVRHFTIGDSMYVGIASFYDGKSFKDTVSPIYKWMLKEECLGNGVSCGVPVQWLPSGNARGLTPISIGTETFIAISNYYDGVSYNIASKIYRWIPDQSCFGDGAHCGNPFQEIPTIGAAGWASFRIAADDYIVVANEYDGSLFTLDSFLYVWMPSPGCFGDGKSCAGGRPATPLP